MRKSIRNEVSQAGFIMRMRPSKTGDGTAGLGPGLVRVFSGDKVR